MVDFLGWYHIYTYIYIHIYIYAYTKFDVRTYIIYIHHIHKLAISEVSRADGKVQEKVGLSGPRHRSSR